MPIGIACALVALLAVAVVSGVNVHSSLRLYGNSSQLHGTTARSVVFVGMFDRNASYIERAAHRGSSKDEVAAAWDEYSRAPLLLRRYLDESGVSDANVEFHEHVVCGPSTSLQDNAADSLCGILQGLEVPHRPQHFGSVLMAFVDGRRWRSVEGMNLMRSAESMALIALRLARAPLRRLHSMSDVEAIVEGSTDSIDDVPLSLAISDARQIPKVIFFAQPTPAGILSQSNAACALLAPTASHFALTAHTYLVEDVTMFHRVWNDFSETNCVANMTTVIAQPPPVFAVVVRPILKSSFKSAQPLCASPLQQIADKRSAGNRGKAAVSAAIAFSAQQMNGPVLLEGIALISDYLYDSVASISTPLHRDILHSRRSASKCELFYFSPNLFHYGVPPLVPPRLPPMASYYATRLRRVATRHGCAVQILDPQVERQMFLSFGFDGSLYQTSAQIKRMGGRSFSGKTRDTIIAVVINGTHRSLYTIGYFDVGEVSKFVAEAINNRVSATVMSHLVPYDHLLMPQCTHNLFSTFTSPNSVRHDSSVFAPWERFCLPTVLMGSYDTFDHLVLSDLQHGTMVVLADGEGCSRGAVEALLQIASHPSRWGWLGSGHQLTAEEMILSDLRFVVIDMRYNSVPRYIATHTDLTALPPGLLYVSKAMKRNHSITPIVRTVTNCGDSPSANRRSAEQVLRSVLPFEKQSR